jgi:hypothetical protein
MFSGMTESRGAVVALRGAAVAALAMGVVLLLGTWDGLYDALDLPQGLPALTTQIGGMSLIGLAYLLWSAAPRPALAPVAALAGFISLGGSALVIAAWLLLQDPSDDLDIDTLGTVILILVAAVLALVAACLAYVSLRATR